MPLANHIDSKQVEKLAGSGRSHLHIGAYSSRYDVGEVPKFTLPESGMASEAAYRVVHEELMLDGKPELNCATFLAQWMEPEAEKLIQENITKNFVDVDGFPSSVAIHERCVSMLAQLWNSPTSGQALGTVCGGSSEGVILGGLAMKWAWREKRKKAGQDFRRPNVVLGSNAHCCIEKFARYFDVEARIVPVKREDGYTMDAQECVKYCDINTIGVFSILGSTYTGHYEDVSALSKALDELHQAKGIDIPIHVDAASGGFVAPFATPALKWDFRVKRVVSINASGHKFGLVYAGLGWVVWKSQELLHKDLIFEMHYLGVPQRSFSLNFSRPSSHMIAQYYNFIRLGRKGYRSIIEACLANAAFLSRALEKSTLFKVLSGAHLEKSPGIPLVAFAISDGFQQLVPDVDVADVAGLVRTRGWMLPVYSLPKPFQSTRILRVVVKEGMSRDMACRLVDDIVSACNTLIKRHQSGSKHTTHIFELMEEESAQDPFDAHKPEVKPTAKKLKYPNLTFSSIC